MNFKISTPELQDKITRLETLRERVRAATGPDRTIDADLFAALDFLVARRCYWNGAMGKPYDIEEIPKTGMGWQAVVVSSPHYTASIDASLALVEKLLPRWTINGLSQDDHKKWWCHIQRGYQTSYDKVVASKKGSTLPLAILDALLTALIEQERG